MGSQRKWVTGSMFLNGLLLLWLLAVIAPYFLAARR